MLSKCHIDQHLGTQPGEYQWRTIHSTNFEILLHRNGYVVQKWKTARSVTSHLEILTIICWFLSQQFGDETKTVTHDCNTELVIPIGKKTLCHPNNQGEGEWGDWVLHGCDNSRKLCGGKMCVYLPEQ